MLKFYVHIKEREEGKKEEEGRRGELIRQSKKRVKDGLGQERDKTPEEE